MIATPLQVVLCWHPAGDSAGILPPPFIEAAYRAFAGRSSLVEDVASPTGVPVWITGAELKPVEIRRFLKPPAIPAGRLLDGALHTLVVAWVGDKLLAEYPRIREMAERNMGRG
jgi:hypothetical protein